MSYSTQNTSATWPWQATPAPAKLPCSKPCCMPAAQSRRQAPSNAAARCPISTPSKKSADIPSTPPSPASTTRAGQPLIHVNLIDTPGYPDFRGPTLSALAAVETLAVVVDADAGIGYGTRRMMEYAQARKLCRVIVVNKIDHDPGKLGALLDELRETFGNEVLPLNLPADGGKAVVDCFGNRSGDSDLGPVADWHQKIIDQVVEINEG
jgi:hypothetical protein